MITEMLWLAVAGFLFILLVLAVVEIAHLKADLETQKILNICQKTTIRNYHAIIQKLQEENQKCLK